MQTNQDVLRVANCSGFYGDRAVAALEMVEGGPIDVLTGDYLAELTMAILWKARRRDPAAGYATTFLRHLESVLGLCLERNIKVVVNAGGLNPAGLADAVRALGDRLGLAPQVAHVEGDDLLPRLADLQAAGHRLEHLERGTSLADAGVEPVSANAYLGAWGIADALGAGADIVICPRVTDASLVVGPAAWHFGWARDDWDALAGAVVAGHVIECGPQATGGNYAFFHELPNGRYPGFPLAELRADGTSVITKHDGTGGAVTVDTVTAQLLYEVADPGYANPDVVTRFDTIHLAQEAPDRVTISGVRGEPAPSDLKVCINYLGGWRNSMTFVLTGLDLEAKAARLRSMFLDLLGGEGAFDAFDVRFTRQVPLTASLEELATAEPERLTMQVSVKGQDEKKVGRGFSNAAFELALASYPGFYTTTPPTAATQFAVYWPTLVPADTVPHRVVLPDGTVHDIPPPNPSAAATAITPPPSTESGPPPGPASLRPLGTLFGARSGDKGGNANVGVWARSDAAYGWLASFLTLERFGELLPETSGLTVDRFELANLRALNFVVVGLLGDGVASSLRFDAQAKALGEQLRSCVVEIPDALDA